jgi:proteasome assembly chaperone (PAC2) family protein
MGGMGLGRKTQNLKVFDAPTAEELIHNLKATEVNV